MLKQVVYDIKYFLVVLAIIMLVFSNAFSVVNIDISYFKRLPNPLAYFVLVLRLAFGDFRLLDPYQTFDLRDEETDEYLHSYTLMIFTFFINVLAFLIIFMILMNILIGIIANSYSTIIANSLEHSYI